MMMMLILIVSRGHADLFLARAPTTPALKPHLIRDLRNVKPSESFLFTVWPYYSVSCKMLFNTN